MINANAKFLLMSNKVEAVGNDFITIGDIDIELTAEQIEYINTEADTSNSKDLKRINN